MPALRQRVATKNRNRLQQDERRDQLLEAGLDLFQTKTYDEVSIDDIAKAVGVSKGLLYHYFGGKRAFYVAVVRLAADRLVAAVSPDRSLDPAAQAFTGLNAYLDFVESRSGVFVAFMQGGLGTDPEVEGIIRETRALFAQQMLDGAGVTGDRPVFTMAARTYVGAVEAASLAWMDDPRVTREQLIVTLLSGLNAILLAAAALDPDAGLEIEPNAHAALLQDL